MSPFSSLLDDDAGTGTATIHHGGAAKNLDLELPYDDNSNVHNDHSSVVGTDDGERDEAKQGGDEPLIGQAETKRVIRLKVAVLVVLILSTVVVATSTYYYLSYREHQAFTSQYTEDSNKVLEAMGSSMDKTLGLLDTLAVAMISVARATNQTWPYVTMPDFAVRLSKILPLTDALVINVMPFIRNDQRLEWEKYAEENHAAWIEESVRVQDEWDDGYFGPVVYNGVHNNSVLHSDFEDLPYNITDRDFLPLWQNFPVIPNTSYTYNWDWYSFFYHDEYKDCLEQHKVVYSSAYMTPEPNNSVAEAETQAWADYYKDYLKPGENPIEPMSDIAYPIVERMADHVLVAGAKDHNATGENVAVGILVASFRWRAMIANILPHGSNGIRVVMQMCSDDWFTYQINGLNVEYLGVGDYHETKYDSMVINLTLSDLQNYSSRTAGYSGAPLIEPQCYFGIRLYPSTIMEASHTSNNPAILTSMMVLIFAFTSLIFSLYDSSVAHRQDTVLKTAVRSSAIVSSLFPSTVRDRLYPDMEERTSPRPWHRSDINGLSDPDTQDPAVNVSAQAASCAPIAELYPDTTVLFADIAGFTSWSSSRQPTQVFHLLETLYAAFDEIAKQRGVFKVETIGDCYVAAVGLPTPRMAHAVVMVRFAFAIRDKMNELTVDLETILGPNTSKLALRIGINSGPTTAGVLRGEKSRFQLFGDTVNTAARMESNGERNRIHISESTAELVEAAGKGHWLTCRSEQVNCKGKGWMTTYWCEPKAGSNLSRVPTHMSSVNEGDPNSSEQQGLEPLEAENKCLTNVFEL